MKSQRHAKILEIIRDCNVTTQDEIQERLTTAGYNVTQATVSRDIKEMHIIKALDRNGNYRYIPGNTGESGRDADNIKAVLRHSILSIDFAGNLLVIKCKSGTANAACACLDEMQLDGTVGSISGDDTFLIVARGENDARSISQLLKTYMI